MNTYAYSAYITVRAASDKEAAAALDRGEGEWTILDGEQIAETCEDCHGTGETHPARAHMAHEVRDCETCAGTGEVGTAALQRSRRQEEI